MEISFTVLDKDRAKMLRDEFISAFIDIHKNQYHEHIGAMRAYSDGDFYNGYLWDFLLDNINYDKECDMQCASEYLCSKKSVFLCVTYPQTSASVTGADLQKNIRRIL